MSGVYEAVLASIAPQLESALEASRARPLPASPSALAAEPGHSAQLFDRLLAEAVAGARMAPEPRAMEPAEPFDPVGAGVEQLLAAFASGRSTPTAVLEALAPLWVADGVRADAVLRLIDGAAEAAAESTRRWADGSARALEGVPFAVKDIIDVEGAIVTSGSLQTGDRVAPADATAVARLRAAGAIPVFMAATTEFACGGPVSRRYGAVRNPWDPLRWTGGSSTGSGAALAARLVPLALGSDTGGSIRVPSALCGTTGIKPTYGLVPRTGVASLSWTLDHVGPMARSARDLALALAVLAGPDGVDPVVPATIPPLALDDSVLEGLRIGAPRGWFVERVDRSVLDAYESALDTLRGLGAEIVDLELEGIGEADSEGWTVFYGELASNQEANAARAELFDDGTRARFELSSVPSAADYLRALRRRPLVQRDVLERMDAARVDLLVTPGVGATAPLLADLTMSVDGERFNLHEVIPRNTRVFDYLGFPALMMPAGFASDGLPVGVQLVGRPWSDGLCLSACAAFQDATAHHLPTPPGPPTKGSSHH
ncbi:amidase [Rathayibacter sp. VKM Ac-2803]|uniref:amidase n=1 Tax=Rathayibacter sp. VKM Ac-2803 TaxID=2609256 RepID=UPI00194F330A|nr:amidase [Rathayibacter sp. VKM Ac-2803]